MYFLMLTRQNMLAISLILIVIFSILLYALFLVFDRLLFSCDNKMLYKTFYLYLLSVFYIFLPVLMNLFFTLTNTGLEIFLYEIIICKTADSGALVVGKKYGKAKLASKISPNKTVAGFIGSIIIGSFFSIVFYLISPVMRNINFLLHVLGGVVMIIVNNIGDLFESYLKRINNVKDSSNMLGEIGGVLDLIDGVLPSTYLMFLYYNFIRG